MEMMLNADWVKRGSALSPHFRLGSRTFFEQEAAEPRPYPDPSKEGKGTLLYGMSEEIPGRMAIARPSALALHGLGSGLGLEERGHIGVVK